MDPPPTNSLVTFSLGFTFEVKLSNRSFTDVAYLAQLTTIMSALLAGCCLLLMVFCRPAEALQVTEPVNLTIGYLPNLMGEHREKHGLSISGAITLALEQIKLRKILPDGVNLSLRFNDTKSDQLVTTKALTEMMCRDVVAVFGPENTCNIEATISSAWNRMMISHVSPSFIQSNLTSPNLECNLKLFSYYIK